MSHPGHPFVPADADGELMSPQDIAKLPFFTDRHGDDGRPFAAMPQDGVSVVDADRPAIPLAFDVPTPGRGSVFPEPTARMRELAGNLPPVRTHVCEEGRSLLAKPS